MAEFALKGEQRVFMTGNEVCAWACVAAKADIMYGYPITPQNEVMHYWTRLAPKRRASSAPSAEVMLICVEP